jgi:hypothetical protein
MRKLFLPDWQMAVLLYGLAAILVRTSIIDAPTSIDKS